MPATNLKFSSDPDFPTIILMPEFLEIEEDNEGNPLSEEDLYEYTMNVVQDHYLDLQTDVFNSNMNIQKEIESLGETLGSKNEIIEDIIFDFFLGASETYIEIEPGYYQGFSIFVDKDKEDFESFEKFLIEEGEVPKIIANNISESIRNIIIAEMSDLLKENTYRRLKVAKRHGPHAFEIIGNQIDVNKFI